MPEPLMQDDVVALKPCPFGCEGEPVLLETVETRPDVPVADIEDAIARAQQRGVK
jgi:hypothetical protein